MKSLLLLSLTLPTLFTFTAKAAGPTEITSPKVCEEEVWIPVSSSSQAVTDCLQGKFLTRINVEKRFPKLGNKTFRVEIWQGSYGRAIVKTERYQRTIVNHCKGTKVVLGGISIPRRQYLEYDVQNPNLSDSISASYQLAPMTMEEAQASLTRAREICSAWGSPSSIF